MPIADEKQALVQFKKLWIPSLDFSGGSTDQSENHIFSLLLLK
jgi:hypothetical protein